MITLSKEQKYVHDNVVSWVNDYFSGRYLDKKYISVAGLAGTGKTTLIGFITKTLKQNRILRIAYVAYTGKASSVLKRKLEDKGEYGESVSTIHSLIYKPIVNKKGIIIGWKLKPTIFEDLIIVDEGSMINKKLWNDLLSYNKPIIVTGDHGQLPPIGEDNFSLMKNPDFILKKIHRQALENPIIKLSLFARKNGYVPEGIFGKKAAVVEWTNQIAQNAIEKFNIKKIKDTQILCGMNKTRVKLNKYLRAINNLERYEPYKDERIICLKNDREKNIMNGQIARVLDIKIINDLVLKFKIKLDGTNEEMKIYSHHKSFNLEKYDTVLNDTCRKQMYEGLNTDNEKINVFDFGYSISVHKSQGSEFEKVILINERNSFQTDDDYSRWLYTGLTRARDKLLMINDFF